MSAMVEAAHSLSHPADRLAVVIEASQVHPPHPLPRPPLPLVCNGSRSHTVGGRGHGKIGGPRRCERIGACSPFNLEGVGMHCCR